MRLDGILWDGGKGGKRRGGKQRSRQSVYTVSARMREKNTERQRTITVIVVLVVVVVGFGWLTLRGLAAAGRHLFSENDRYLVRVWDFDSNGPLLTPAHIREYGGLQGDENLFALNLRELRRRLESVPVVRSAEVTRRLPDTLMIRVDERMAVARLGGESRMALAVDAAGHVLGPGSLRPNLPAIEGLRQPGLRPGVDITDSAFHDALRLLELTRRPNVGNHVHIRTINVSDAERFDIRLAGGAQVLMTRAHLESRLAELVGIMQNHATGQRSPRVINMTGEANIPPVVQY